MLFNHQPAKPSNEFNMQKGIEMDSLQGKLGFGLAVVAALVPDRNMS